MPRHVADNSADKGKSLLVTISFSFHLHYANHACDSVVVFGAAAAQQDFGTLQPESSACCC